MSYECHITCPLEDHRDAGEVAAQQGWKTSQIARDPILGEGTYFYLTSHSIDLLTLYNRMDVTCDILRDRGVRVLRQKIELIVYDTKKQ